MPPPTELQSWLDMLQLWTAWELKWTQIVGGFLMWVAGAIGFVFSCGAIAVILLFVGFIMMVFLM